MHRSLENVQVFMFDLMGTCTDWHTSITTAIKRYPLPPQLTSVDLPVLAIEWRERFFRTIFASFAAGEQSPDIDQIHTQLLDQLLEERNIDESIWSDDVRKELVRVWHDQQGMYPLL